MAQPLLLSVGTALNILAGAGARSAPVAVGSPIAALPTTLPAATLIDVPAGAVAAQFLFDYVGAAGSTNGAPNVTFWFGDGTNAIQAWSPVSPSLDGYGAVSLPGAAAGAHGRSATPPLPVVGWAKAGIAAAEAADVSHPGALTVTVVWIS